MVQFGFVKVGLNLDGVRRLVPFGFHMPAGWVWRLARLLPPRAVWVTARLEVGAGPLFGRVVIVPGLPVAHTQEHPSPLLHRAFRMAAGDGASVIGTDGPAAVAPSPPSRRLVRGDGLRPGAVAAAALSVLRSIGLEPSACRVGLAGAAVGWLAACARLLAGVVGGMCLVDPKPDRPVRLAEAIASEVGLVAEISARPERALPRCAAVISDEGSAGAALRWAARGAVVGLFAPGNAPCRSLRPDLHLFDGVLVGLPGDNPWTTILGLPPGIVPVALAETLLCALHPAGALATQDPRMALTNGCRQNLHFIPSFAERPLTLGPAPHTMRN